MRTAEFLTGTVPRQHLGSHFLEYQQRMTNTVQTGETTLLQLLLLIPYGAEGNLKKKDKLKTEQSGLHYSQKNMICHKQIIPTKLHFSSC